MVALGNIVREDVQHPRFDFDRGAFVVPLSTTDDELHAVIGKVSDTVLDAYATVARAMPEQFVNGSGDLYRDRVAVL